MPYQPTGAGAFGFSLNWEQVPGDKDVARRVITFLEDRRLLFGERHFEDELHCVESANQIRRLLSDELAKAKPGRSLEQSLRAIRIAKLRNIQIHETAPSVYNPASAAQVIASSHKLVAELFG